MRYFLFVLFALFIVGCGPAKRLNTAELVVKSVECSKDKKDVNNYIISLPSRGYLADKLSIGALSRGNDGGFSNDVLKAVSENVKNITVYSQSSSKLSAYVAYALSLFGDNELAGVDFCLIGADKSDELISNAKRTGANIIFIAN